MEKSTYHNQNGFDYILNHLGYRYVIGKIQAKMKKDILFGHIDLENVGFAPIYQKLNIYLKVNGKEILLDDNLNFEIDFSNEEPSQYDIYLHIETDSKQEICLGNNGYSSENHGYCILTLDKK